MIQNRLAIRKYKTRFIYHKDFDVANFKWKKYGPTSHRDSCGFTEKGVKLLQDRAVYSSDIEMNEISSAESREKRGHMTQDLQQLVCNSSLNRKANMNKRGLTSRKKDTTGNSEVRGLSASSSKGNATNHQQHINRNRKNKQQLSIRTPSCRVPYIRIQFGESEPVLGMVDTGSSKTVISQSFLSKLSVPILKHEKVHFSFQSASNDVINCTEAVELDTIIADRVFRVKYLIIEGLPADIILGADFVFTNKFRINLSEGHMTYQGTCIQILNNLGEEVTAAFSLSSITKSNSQDQKTSFGINCDHLDRERLSILAPVLQKHGKVLTEKLGRCEIMPYEIELTDYSPIKAQPFRCSNPERKKAMREIIDRLLANGVIERRNTEYVSRAFLVKKPDGSFRIVQDYSSLNKVLKVDQFPSPTIDEFTESTGLSKATCLTKIDIRDSFFQCALAPDSVQYTGFTCSEGVFCYKSVPQGISFGLQALNKLMDHLFRDLKGIKVCIFADDMLIYSENINQHAADLDEVFSILGNAGITINPAKVELCKAEVAFLGHLVSKDGVTIDPSRVQNLINFPTPRNIKQLVRFVAGANFFRKFVEGFSSIAEPLNKLRRKGAKWTWGLEQQNAFQKLKEILTSPPLLAFPDFSKLFIVQTDACNTGLGAVLLQEEDTGARRPIAYASRGLTDYERKRDTFHLEALAVVWALKKFSKYIEYVKFELETDNQALKYLLDRSHNSAKHHRWLLSILHYRFTVRHIKGTDNSLADALSRALEAERDKYLDALKDDDMLEYQKEPLYSLQHKYAFPVTIPDVGSMQREDADLSEIIERIQSGQRIDNYCLTKGILTFKVKTKNKIVVPDNLKEMVMRYFHESQIAGHLGIFKTVKRIEEIFFWRTLVADVKSFVRSCSICQMAKPSQRIYYGKLSSTEAEYPFEKLQMDYIGPLPRSRGNYRYILGVKDCFTRYCFLLPCRSQNATEACKLLKERIFQHFGICKVMVSDRGGSFRSGIFRKFFFDLGIKHVFTSPYSPSGNRVERKFRDLKSALISYHNNQQHRWDESLYFIQLAFNSAVHESFHLSPAEVMFGRKFVNPLVLQWHIDEILPEVYTQDSLREIWDHVRKHLVANRKRIEKSYANQHGDGSHPFKIGTSVLVKSHVLSNKAKGISKKLMLRYTGPYVISNFNGPCTVELSDADGNVVRTSHIKELKVFRTDDHWDDQK